MNRQSLARRLTWTMAVLGVTSVSFVVWGWHRSAMRQKAVAENPGLLCYYDEQALNDSWLGRTLGLDYIHPVRGVLVFGPVDDWDKALTQLKSLRSLEEVVVTDTQPPSMIESFRRELSVPVRTIGASRWGSLPPNVSFRFTVTRRNWSRTNKDSLRHL